MTAMLPDRNSRYTIPLQIWIAVLRDLIAGGPIDLAKYTRRALRLAHKRPRIAGLEHIPQDGPFIVTANHYQRPGLWVTWCAGLIAVVIRQKRGAAIHYVMVSEFERIGLGPLTFKNPLPGLTQRLFDRIARLAGMVTMPLNQEDRQGRASAMRKLAAMLKDGQIIGIFPEADESLSLREARPGSGGFIALLSNNRVPVIPVGVYEEEHALVVRLGPPFTLSNKRSPASDRDSQETRQRVTIMTNIARLLPPAMHGHYPLPDSLPVQSGGDAGN